MMGFQYNFFSLSIWIKECCFSSTFLKLYTILIFFIMFQTGKVFLFFCKICSIVSILFHIIPFYELRSKKRNHASTQFLLFYFFKPVRYRSIMNKHCTCSFLNALVISKIHLQGCNQFSLMFIII